MKKIKKSGFSLMEMMIVLLIISIVAAATAPLITKKMAKSGGGAGNGAISWLNMKDYGNAGKGSLIIGAKKALINSKVYINSNGSNQPQLGFGSNGTLTGILGIQPIGRISFGGVKDNMAAATADHATAIGSHAQAKGEGSIAFGNQAVSEGKNAVAIGSNSTNPMKLYSFGDFYLQQINPDGSLQFQVRYKGSSHLFKNLDLNVIKNIKSTSAKEACEIGTSNLFAEIAKNGDSTQKKCNKIILFDSYENADNSNKICNANGQNSVAIGAGAVAKGENAVAIGSNANSTKDNELTLGAEFHNVNIPGKIDKLNADSVSVNNLNVIETLTANNIATDNIKGANGKTYINRNDYFSISIGETAYAVGETNSCWATALGWGAKAQKNLTTAIGAGAVASHENSTAIGTGATTTISNQIVLGTKSDTVYIPGNLVVNGATVLGYADDGKSEKYANHKSYVFLRESGHYGDIVRFEKADGDTRWFISTGGSGKGKAETASPPGFPVYTERCDRRLKNVGEKFTAGLEQIKKLDLYNFTFKADKAKTPQVGVMAQDLQKVFPNAVWKGEDGYLRIRWDEMFYAVINAVKELDAKVTTAFEQIKANTDKVTKLQTQVDEQQKVIADLEKRLAKLEKKE